MISYLIQHLFSILPETRLYGLKAFFLRLRGFQIGQNVKVVSSVKINLKQLKIGRNTFIGHESMIVGGDAPIEIGDYVDIGPRCLIVNGTHDIGGPTHRAGQGRSRKIRIGNGTWVGAGSVILGGVSVGTGCVIAAGSVVVRDIEDHCLVGGVPAKRIRTLANDESD